MVLTLEKLSCKKGQKFVLLDNCFSDLFTEVKIWYQNYFEFVLGHFLER